MSGFASRSIESSSIRPWTLAVAVAVAAFSVPACSSSGDDGEPSAATGGAATGGTGTGGVSGAMATGGTATGGTATGGTSGDAQLEYRPCALDARVGAFTIELGDGFTAVAGAVRDAVTATDVPEVLAEDGACKLYRKRNLFCNPPCASGTTCSDALSCVPAPTNQSVGTVSITGLAIPLELMPSGVNSYTNPANPALPHPGFSEGANIVLSASGGAAPFELDGRGIAALALASDSIAVESGRSLAVRWTPPGQAAGQRVRLTFEFNRHGGTPTWLECDAADTGSFNVPAALLDALLELELSGWPTLAAARRTVDSASVAAGCVELRVVSSVTIERRASGRRLVRRRKPMPSTSGVPSEPDMRVSASALRRGRAVMMVLLLAAVGGWSTSARASDTVDLSEPEPEKPKKGKKGKRGKKQQANEAPAVSADGELGRVEVGGRVFARITLARQPRVIVNENGTPAEENVELARHDRAERPTSREVSRPDGNGSVPRSKWISRESRS